MMIYVWHLPQQVAVMRDHVDADAYVDFLLASGACVQAARDTAPSPLHTILLRGWNRGATLTEHDMKLIKLFIRSTISDLKHSLFEKRCTDTRSTKQ